MTISRRTLFGFVAAAPLAAKAALSQAAAAPALTVYGSVDTEVYGPEFGLTADVIGGSAWVLPGDHALVPLGRYIASYT